LRGWERRDDAGGHGATRGAAAVTGFTPVSASIGGLVIGLAAALDG
jgi:hypothetical protein